MAVLATQTATTEPALLTLLNYAVTNESPTATTTTPRSNACLPAVIVVNLLLSTSPQITRRAVNVMPSLHLRVASRPNMFVRHNSACSLRMNTTIIWLFRFDTNKNRHDTTRSISGKFDHQRLCCIFAYFD